MSGDRPSLECDARKRGLKRRGRGTWESDRLPVFGLLCRGGQVRLFVLRNVQTTTIRPIVHQMVARGAQVYTDSYCIYNFLSGAGYQHQVVNHSASQYALDWMEMANARCTVIQWRIPGLGCARPCAPIPPLRGPPFRG